MRQAQSAIRVGTRRGLTDVTRQVADAVAACGVREGLCTVFIRHTSASLVIQENADPAVLSDLERFLSRRPPDGDPEFAHVAEGPDDMPSHVKSVLTRTSEAIPVRDGRLALVAEPLRLGAPPGTPHARAHRARGRRAGEWEERPWEHQRAGRSSRSSSAGLTNR